MSDFGLLSAFGGFITDAVNDQIQGKRQKELLALQQDWQAEQADLARAWSRDVMDYQMAYNASREDTAISRQMADMARNGLNPLAVGSGNGFSAGSVAPVAPIMPVGPSAMPYSGVSSLSKLSDSLFGVADQYLKGRKDARDQARLDLERMTTQQQLEFFDAKTLSTKMDIFLKAKEMPIKDKQLEVMRANIDHLDAMSKTEGTRQSLNDQLRKLSKTNQLVAIEEISKLRLYNERFETMTPDEVAKLRAEIDQIKNSNAVRTSREVRHWFSFFERLVFDVLDAVDGGSQ